MAFSVVCLFGPRTTKLPTLDTNLSIQDIDAKFGFHESSVEEFPIESGVRSFVDDEGNKVLVADENNTADLIKQVSDEIGLYEELLDDVDEEGSDEFDTFTRKCKTLHNIVRLLSQ